jgi:hypothetical protein
MTRQRLSLVVLSVAIAILAIGTARALDLGGGGSSTKVDHNAHMAGMTTAGTMKHHEAAGPPSTGLDNGRYALSVQKQVLPVGARRMSFDVIDTRTGKPVTGYDEDLTKKLHLIVVREDLTRFQHVHPTLGSDGRWTVTEAVLSRAGPWRLIADFIPAGGARTVLATTVQATGGAYDVRPFRESSRIGDHRWRTTVAGYEVTLEGERFAGGASGALRFKVRRDGKPVTDLQPYLGARGHAVLLRWGDVAYVHVHPREGSAAPGAIDFDVTYPRAAPLGLFLQFRHAGRVHTAHFELPTPGA